MELEEYFHSIQQEKPMIHKDTTVSVMIDQDNSDMEEFPDQHIRQTMKYSGPSWIQITEDFLKLLEVHFGYPIREHVYYSVQFPMFDHNLSPAPGREMNQDVFNDIMTREENNDLNNLGKHQPYEWQ